MRLRQSVGNINAVFQGLIQPQLPPPDHLGQRFAPHVLHLDELDSIRLRDVVDVNNIGMVESRRRFGLLHEPQLAIGIGDFPQRQNLDRHEPVQRRVRGPVHHAHFATDERFEDVVLGIVLPAIGAMLDLKNTLCSH
jgi:hypothetical protein